MAAGKDFPLLEALGPDGKMAMASVDSVPPQNAARRL